MTAPPELLARLSQHRTLGQAPPDELAWLAEHGEMSHVEPGDVMTKSSYAMESLIVVLSGHFAIYVDRGYGPRKVTEWTGGDVSGYLPYSRMIKPPGDGIVSEPGDVLMVNRRYFPEMILRCPWVTATLVHVMIDRARLFTSSDLQDEKMASLGRLAAGLAHELNNPASAAARSAALLEKGLARAEAASRALGAAGLSAEQQAIVDRVHHTCTSGKPSQLSPVERADREEAIAGWLTARGLHLDAAIAASLTDTGASAEALDTLARAVDGHALETTIEWIAADCAIHTLAYEVERAASRIHQLVAAVKRFTYMDKPGVPDAVDVEQGLRDTILVLGSKGRLKSVAITVDVEPNLPRVHGFGGQLNQVWSNLIDNALDAVPASGHVRVEAKHELGSVVVRIVDDGPGIPPDIRDKIFEPFFTTKPVGQGTGLGLDIARRLARHNGGDIEVESVPGHTEFRVILPRAPESARGAG